MTKAEWTNRPMTPKRQAARARYEEFRAFSECWPCTFLEWLNTRNTQWYSDLKAGRNVTRWWQEDYIG